eukprot:CAMPEP_0198150464 /NCGR_PEP_ID=MMETSP1443-20131203/51037_1 /TAXON_ID=186043 /ORGANISM="Entomoneis sp., Strain CCMP2396" /LENGTH=275 /DNA_ID=CAMNT_0043815773 /DNA_START=319 /DNA_END=1146 /DNA_ORIENTATION=-
MMLEPLIPVWCDEKAVDTSLKYANPEYVKYSCSHIRFPHLLFLTPEECDFGRRLVMSVFLGAIIGWERRMADRPAGIRTMSLVSLASCLFTICSAFAFLSGPMSWDSSRISAAIPSGVGFLGAGLIFKEAQKDELTGIQQHVVHGLTTATSVWLSAAVGVACGGSMYFVASFSTAIMLILLRFGPRGNDMEEESDDEEEEELGTLGLIGKETACGSERGVRSGNYGSERGEGTDRETDQLIKTDPSVASKVSIDRMDSKLSLRGARHRAALGSVV